jgi:hypothetical protein
MVPGLSWCKDLERCRVCETWLLGLLAFPLRRAIRRFAQFAAKVPSGEAFYIPRVRETKDPPAGADGQVLE